MGGFFFFKFLSEWLCSRTEPLQYLVPILLLFFSCSEMEKQQQPKPVFSTHCDFLNIIIPLGLFWFYMILDFTEFSSLPLNATVNPFTHFQLSKSAFSLFNPLWQTNFKDTFLIVVPKLSNHPWNHKGYKKILHTGSLMPRSHSGLSNCISCIVHEHMEESPLCTVS